MMYRFTNVSIVSYTAKYASSYYGPFRDALDSHPGSLGTNRRLLHPLKFALFKVSEIRRHTSKTLGIVVRHYERLS